MQKRVDSALHSDALHPSMSSSLKICPGLTCPGESICYLCAKFELASGGELVKDQIKKCVSAQAVNGGLEKDVRESKE